MGIDASTIQGIAKEIETITYIFCGGGCFWLVDCDVIYGIAVTTIAIFCF